MAVFLENELTNWLTRIAPPLSKLGTVNELLSRHFYVERKSTMTTLRSEHIQTATTGNISVSAMTENRDRIVVSIC